jgi:hypothetical protein
MTDKKIDCNSRKPVIEIKRLNSIWIQINWSQLNYKPFCYISEMIRGKGENRVKFGKYLVFYPILLNFHSFYFR